MMSNSAASVSHTCRECLSSPCKQNVAPALTNSYRGIPNKKRSGTSFVLWLHCQQQAFPTSGGVHGHASRSKKQVCRLWRDDSRPGLIERTEKASRQRGWQSKDLGATSVSSTVRALSKSEEQRWGSLMSLMVEMERVREHLLEMQARHMSALESYESDQRRKSLENFLHWIALRNINLQGLQTRLSAFGLSSLSWSDSHILHSVNCVIHGLRSLLALELISRMPLLEHRPPTLAGGIPLRLQPLQDATLPPPASSAVEGAEAVCPYTLPMLDDSLLPLGGFERPPPPEEVLHSGMRFSERAILTASSAIRRKGSSSAALAVKGASVRGNAGRDGGAAAYVVVADDGVLPEVALGLGLPPPPGWLGEGAAGAPAVVEVQGGDERYKAVTLEDGRAMLRRNAEDLLGPEPAERRTRVMVTLPAEAAEDNDMVMDLVAAGMNLARVNCAHDTPDVWAGIIANVRDASARLGVTCRILMDLAGPKLRTGCLAPGPKLAKIRPAKDIEGHVVEPALVWLLPDGVPIPDGEEGADAALPTVSGSSEVLASLRPGDLLEFKDTRGKRRALQVVDREDEGGKEGGVWAEGKEVAYVSPGTEFWIRRAGKRGKGKREKRKREKVCVADLPALEVPIVLEKGDTLVLTQEDLPGCGAERDSHGRVVRPAHIACTLSAAYKCVRPGDPVLLDDGKIKCVVRLVTPEKMVLEVSHVNGRAKLRGEKSINFPESDLQLKGLNRKDLTDLSFVARHADMVAFSFVNDADDVRMLQDELEKMDAGHLGIVLKIETRSAFENLPQMLFQGYRRAQPLGVMIARGDLFVEVGWEAMGDVQDQILWMCEATHVPTIWATQVLENLTKTGAPSRAEITDAVSSQRAECVMLNKGPHILQAVSSLSNILQSAGRHHSKKQPILQPLPICKEFDIL